MEQIRYITAKEAKFYKNKGGFLGLALGEAKYDRVTLLRAFPFSYVDSFVSVRDKEEKEIGIIRDINDFPEETIQLFKEEMDRRYFLPMIEKIHAITEEFGYSYWHVATNVGEKNFICRRDSSSFVSMKGKMILVVDVDGNRYEISDYTKLDGKSYRLIELML